MVFINSEGDFKRGHNGNYRSGHPTIPCIGEAKIPSPIKRGKEEPGKETFVSDDDRVLIDLSVKNVTRRIAENKPLSGFELAGPRRKIYFDPSKLRCALVTCGGLCPGLNDIIRSIVFSLYHGYGVRNISASDTDCRDLSRNMVTT